MRILALGVRFTKLSQFGQEGLDLGCVLFDRIEFRPLKLRQILGVAIEDLKRKVNLGEAVIQEMKDKPPPKVVADPPGRVAEQEIGIKPKLPLFDSFDDLSFLFVVGGHREFIGRGGGKQNRPYFLNLPK